MWLKRGGGMMSSKYLVTSIFLLLIGGAIGMFPALAFPQTQAGQIEIRVDGLSCPFCAYGLEKKLKQLEGTAEVIIDMKRGVVEIKVLEGETITEEDLNKAVADAGFTPRKITYHSDPPQ